MAALAGLIGSTQCCGLFMEPEDVPVERVLATAEAALAKNPKSAQAHYTVARIRYLAFSRGMKTVPAYLPEGAGEELTIPGEYLTWGWVESRRWEKARELSEAEVGGKWDRWSNLTNEKQTALQTATERHFKRHQNENWRPTVELDSSQRASHAVASLAAFHAAIQLKPKEAFFRLGLASLIEQIVDWRFREKPKGLPEPLVALDYAQARKTFLQAFRTSVAKDASVASLGPTGLTELVSFEAGGGYLRLSDRALLTTKLDDDALRAEIQAHRSKLEKIPQGAVTPIIFATTQVFEMSALLDGKRIVDFDLRGYGPRESWSWVKPTTGLLVWDPSRSGHIVSGRQLFGGYTFQIFRKDGYDALAALDDDCDGALRGTELTGIRVWFDRNSDGISAAEEVVDLESLGIVAISVRTTHVDGIHPTNPRGLTLADGRVLPTWDWMVEPHRE